MRFHAKKSSANRYDTNQAKVWTANPYVNHKAEVNTEIFDGQLYQLIRRSGITVCRSHYPLSRDVCKEDKVGDKSRVSMS